MSVCQISFSEISKMGSILCFIVTVIFVNVNNRICSLFTLFYCLCLFLYFFLLQMEDQRWRKTIFMFKVTDASQLPIVDIIPDPSLELSSRRAFKLEVDKACFHWQGLPPPTPKHTTFQRGRWISHTRHTSGESLVANVPHYQTLNRCIEPRREILEGFSFGLISC